MIVRGYIMLAKEGQEEGLKAVLKELAGVLSGVNGYRGADMLHDNSNARRFLFIEKWDDEAAHKAAGPGLPKELLGRLMNMIESPLDGSYYAYDAFAG